MKSVARICLVLAAISTVLAYLVSIATSSRLLPMERVLHHGSSQGKLVHSNYSGFDVRLSQETSHSELGATDGNSTYGRPHVSHIDWLEKVWWGMLVLIPLGVSWPLSNLLCKMPSVNRRVIGSIFLGQAVRSIDYSILIPAAYDVAASYDASAMFSGWLIGAYYGFAMFGAFLAWAFDLQSSSFRRSTLILFAMLPICAIAYGLVPCFMSRGIFALPCLLCIRIVASLIAGVIGQLHMTMLADISEKRWLTGVYMGVSLVESVGIGIGPAINSILLRVAARFLPVVDQEVAAVAIGPFFMSVAYVVVFLFFCTVLPRNEEVSSAVAALVDPENAENECGKVNVNDGHRQTAASMFMLVHFLMTCTSAGIETVTAVILEVDYGLDVSTVGYIVGFCIVAYLPAYIFAEWIQPYIGESHLSRFAILTAVPMSILLQPRVCAVLSRYLPNIWCGWLIICADVFSWSPMVVALGLSEAHAYESVPRHASVISIAGSISCSIGYAISPSLGRYVWAHGGIPGYGFAQLFLLVLAFVINETGLLHMNSIPV